MITWFCRSPLSITSATAFNFLEKIGIQCHRRLVEEKVPAQRYFSWPAYPPPSSSPAMCVHTPDRTDMAA